MAKINPFIKKIECRQEAMPTRRLGLTRTPTLTGSALKTICPPTIGGHNKQDHVYPWQVPIPMLTQKNFLILTFGEQPQELYQNVVLCSCDQHFKGYSHMHINNFKDNCHKHKQRKITQNFSTNYSKNSKDVILTSTVLWASFRKSFLIDALHRRSKLANFCHDLMQNHLLYLLTQKKFYSSHCF